jgi:hypothetical protein
MAEGMRLQVQWFAVVTKYLVLLDELVYGMQDTCSSHGLTAPLRGDGGK